MTDDPDASGVIDDEAAVARRGRDSSTAEDDRVRNDPPLILAGRQRGMIARRP